MESGTTTYGLVVASANSGFIYMTDAGYSGADNFNFTQLDGQGDKDIGAVIDLIINSSMPVPPSSDRLQTLPI